MPQVYKTQHFECKDTSLLLSTQRLFCTYRIYTSPENLFLFPAARFRNLVSISVKHTASVAKTKRTTHKLTQNVLG